MSITLSDESKASLVGSNTERKLDFATLLGDPDKQQPRTLREIADEVGFPFTARAVADGGGCKFTCKAGDEVMVLGERSETLLICHHHPYIDENGQRINYTRPVLRRWILLGHK